VASLFFCQSVLSGIIYTVSLAQQQKVLTRSSGAALLAEDHCTELRLRSPGASGQLCPVLALLQHSKTGANKQVSVLPW